METMADILKSPEFSVGSMTAAINLLPYKPSRLGAMGLFSEEGVATTSAKIEEYNGTLHLIKTQPRNAPATASVHEKRKVRSLDVLHIPREDAVLPDDVQNVRKFGSGGQLESAIDVVNRRLTKMRQDHEVTLEYLRIGAVQGKIIDADGTVLYDLFTEFDVAEQSTDFVLGTTTTKQRLKCLAVKRQIEAALGAAAYDHVHAICGASWFDRFISHTDVEKAYDRWNDGAQLRSDPRAGFPFAGIIFEEYRGKVGDRDFIPPDQARFFPVGVPDLFITYFGPANFMQTVNTIGLPLYARQEPIRLDQGIQLHTQQNPLPICTRPSTLVKGTSSN